MMLMVMMMVLMLVLTVLMMSMMFIMTMMIMTSIDDVTLTIHIVILVHHICINRIIILKCFFFRAEGIGELTTNSIHIVGRDSNPGPLNKCAKAFTTETRRSLLKLCMS